MRQQFYEEGILTKSHLTSHCIKVPQPQGTSTQKGGREVKSPGPPPAHTKETGREAMLGRERGALVALSLSASRRLPMDAELSLPGPLSRRRCL